MMISHQKTLILENAVIIFMHKNSSCQKSTFDFVFENKWGVYKATIYCPLEQHISHPVVVFAHGFAAWKGLYKWVAESLMSQRYTALLFTVPNHFRIEVRQWSDGIRSAIDYLFSKENPLSDVICTEKVGAMGHSMGGLGALIAASEDSRINCVIGLAPAILPKYRLFLPIPRQVYEISIPIQIQIGSKDGIIAPKDVRAFYDDLSSKDKSLIEIQGGNHIRFIDKGKTAKVGKYMMPIGIMKGYFRDGTPEISFEEQHSISCNNFLECYRQHLDKSYDIQNQYMSPISKSLLSTPNNAKTSLVV
jgi:predicted dienelactone hydrolase